MIEVVSLTKTCESCPAQWEGRTAAGGFVYVRYRFGGLQVGIGITLDAAVADETIDREVGDDYDGCLEYDELKRLTLGDVRWPA